MISVIIPAYNAENTIKDCLKSLQKQKEQLEIILVNDGSTDDTLSRVKEFAHLVNVVVISHGGVSKARNAGLASANGEWIVFLDSDDILLSDALSIMKDYMSDDVDAVCGGIIRGNEKKKNYYANAGELYLSGHDLINYVLADPTNRLTLHAWAFRKKEEMPEFDPGLRVGEDSDWVLRYLYNASKAVFFSDPVYRYTISDNSVVHKWNRGQEKEYINMMKVIKSRGAEKEKDWPLFVLTNYLLILTHVVFHPNNPDNKKCKFESAHELRIEPIIDDAFKHADFNKLRGVKRIVLESLNREQVGFACLAVKLRQLQNKIKMN